MLGIVFLAYWFWPKLSKRRWSILLMTPLFLLTLQGFKIRMATLVTLTDSSLWYRVRIWQGVIKALPSFWLWGAGPGSFPMIYPWYQIKDTVSAHAHQIFLQLWLENGILSLASFLWLIKKMNLGFTKAHQLTKGIAMVIMIFLGYGLTETWFQNRLIGGYFWLFCGLWISSKGEGLVAE
jgi:putative inorganic carbon (HCO3(-)) transporter